MAHPEILLTCASGSSNPLSCSAADSACRRVAHVPPLPELPRQAAQPPKDCQTPADVALRWYEGYTWWNSTARSLGVEIATSASTRSGINRYQLEALITDRWLTSSVVDFFGEELEQHTIQRAPLDASVRKVVVMPVGLWKTFTLEDAPQPATYQFECISEKELVSNLVTRTLDDHWRLSLLPKDRLFEIDGAEVALLPAHTGGTTTGHFALFALDLQAKRGVWVDSINHDMDEVVLGRVRAWADGLAAVKGRPAFDWSKWTFTSAPVPMQADSHSCGVYVIKMMQELSLRKTWTTSKGGKSGQLDWSFNASDMKWLRMKYALDVKDAWQRQHQPVDEV